MSIKADMGLHNSMERLERKRQELNLCFILMGGGVIGFAISMMFPVSNGAMQLFFYAGIACVILGGVRFNKVHKEFKAIYKEIFVEEPIVKNFDNAIYLPTRGIIESDVRAFNLCMMGNRFHSEDYIKASYMGVQFEVSDVKVQQHTNTGKSSHTTTYFQGRMMVFDFPEKLVSSVRVYSSSFKYRALGFKSARNDKIEMESQAFNRGFDVYSMLPHDAFYLITPQFMEKLSFLAAKYHSIAMHVCGNRIVIGFNEPTNNAFDAKGFGKISYPEEMAKIQADIDDIKTIITIIRDITASGPNVGPLAPDMSQQAQDERRIQLGQTDVSRPPMVDPAALGRPGLNQGGGEDVMGLLRKGNFKSSL